MSIKDLESEALRLSAKDRALLAEHLLLSLDESEEPDCEQLWLLEAQERYRAYKQGEVTGRPAVDAFRNARSKIQ